MKIKNVFDVEKGAVFVTIRGEITVEHLIDNEMNILENPEYRKCSMCH